jgi:hypothetical protein
MLEPHDNGGFVAYGDYLTLQRRFETLQRERDEAVARLEARAGGPVGYLSSIGFAQLREGLWTKIHPQPIGMAKTAVYLHPPIGDAAGRDSVDAERLDFMLTRGAWLTWSKDRECCRLFIRDENGEASPFFGWGPGRNFNTGREAIDACIASLTEPATGDKP